MEPSTIKATQLRTKTRDLMERVKYKGERFIVETFGRPMAVIISLDDFERVRKALASRQKLLAHEDTPEVPEGPPRSLRKKSHVK